MVNIVKDILGRIHHTPITVHAPDYGENKRAETFSACHRSDKQALPRLPHSLCILSASGLPFIHDSMHYGHDMSVDLPAAPVSSSDLMHQSSLSINA
jgi:hypothetical protein